MTVTEFQVQMNKWDGKLSDYMHAVENRCHKYKMGRIKYSPDMNFWLKQQLLISQVILYLK